MTKKVAIVCGLNYKYTSGTEENYGNIYQNGKKYPLGSGSVLRGCVSDAVNVAYELTDRYGFDKKDITIHHDDNFTNASVADQSKVEKLRGVNEKLPYRSDILDSIKNAISDDDNTVLFLSFAGHGTRSVDLDGDEEDGYDECICTYDKNGSAYTYDDEFYRIINRETKNRKTPIIIYTLFDCCHSGTVFDMKYRVNRYDNKTHYDVNTRFSGRDFENKDVTMICISGCKDSELSSEAPIGSISEGFCTNSFCRASQDMFRGDNKSVVDFYYLLIDKLEEKWGNNRNLQKPTLSSNVDFREKTVRWGLAEDANDSKTFINNSSDFFFDTLDGKSNNDDDKEPEDEDDNNEDEDEDDNEEDDNGPNCCGCSFVIKKLFRNKKIKTVSIITGIIILSLILY